MTPSTDKKKILLGILAAAFWLIVWQAAAMAVGQELILPSPLSVLKTLFRLVGEGGFWLSAGRSLLHVIGGYVCGVSIATALAALTARFAAVNVLMGPLLRIVRSTPVASFIILALLWIGKGSVPGFISALMVIPVVWSAADSALRETDGELLELARAYRFGKGKTARLIYIPSAKPAWRAACVTSVGLAWKAGIAAEVLCQPKNTVGAELYYSRIYLETPALFAWTAVVIILSFVFEKLFVKLIRGRGGNGKN